MATASSMCHAEDAEHLVSSRTLAMNVSQFSDLMCPLTSLIPTTSTSPSSLFPRISAIPASSTFTFHQQNL